MYQKFLGGDNNFYRLEVDYRQYKKVGNRKVIAWTAPKPRMCLGMFL